MKRLILALAIGLAIPASAADKPISFSVHPEARPFDANANADAQIEQALATAKTQSGKMVLVVMGGNWCHDSRALAGWFATPRFAAMLKGRYELVYVDAGMPTIGQGKNLHAAKRFGIKKIKGTPTVMILAANGKLLNRKDAPKWRNAASRQEAAIYHHFAKFTAP
jgi:thioredoxin-like negative regulator of GroEL